MVTSPGSIGGADAAKNAVTRPAANQGAAQKTDAPKPAEGNNNVNITNVNNTSNVTVQQNGQSEQNNRNVQNIQNIQNIQNGQNRPANEPPTSLVSSGNNGSSVNPNYRAIPEGQSNLPPLLQGITAPLIQQERPKDNLFSTQVEPKKPPSEAEQNPILKMAKLQGERNLAQKYSALVKKGKLGDAEKLAAQINEQGLSNSQDPEVKKLIAATKQSLAERYNLEMSQLNGKNDDEDLRDAAKAQQLLEQLEGPKQPPPPPINPIDALLQQLGLNIAVPAPNSPAAAPVNGLFSIPGPGQALGAGGLGVGGNSAGALLAGISPQGAQQLAAATATKGLSRAFTLSGQQFLPSANPNIILGNLGLGAGGLGAGGLGAGIPGRGLNIVG